MGAQAVEDVIDLSSDDDQPILEALKPAAGRVTRHGHLSRHFWSAGESDFDNFSLPVQGGMDHARIHPKFLHSNATSHKWALGAMAELLDNAVDEAEHGATFVKVDKGINPRDHSPFLIFMDDGHGMDPQSLRQCMSFGYSQKTATSIGQYGNGFKTSTMRLGADVIVFTRRLSDSGSSTQSIGLLSYTYLWKTGHADIVVPMIDYDGCTRPKMQLRSTMDDWETNLKTILKWSPFNTEAELLKQCDSIGQHGTKVIIFNLWLNDDGILELDFDSDTKDIQLRGSQVEQHKSLYRNHIAHRLRYSFRAYASILYLKMPDNFQIILRGRPVVYYLLAKDLKYPQYIQYKPQISGTGAREVSAITTIGFTKEAPMVNIHGFSVYHKNRLITPFWKVFTDNSSRGRGVIGVLEANFIEPAHDKQDFEKTALLQRLESRLKQMTLEYWELHCSKIGYKSKSKTRKTTPASPLPTFVSETCASQDDVQNRDCLTPERSSQTASEALDDNDQFTPEGTTPKRKAEEAGYSNKKPRKATDLELDEGSIRLINQSRCRELQVYKRRSTELMEQKAESYKELEGKVVEWEMKYAEKCKELSACEVKCRKVEAEKVQEVEEYEKRCQAYELKLAECEKKRKILEDKNAKYKTQRDNADNDLLETKNKYIKLLMKFQRDDVKMELE